MMCFSESSVYTRRKTGNEAKIVIYQNNNLSLLVNSEYMVHKHILMYIHGTKESKERKETEYLTVLHT